MFPINFFYFFLSVLLGLQAVCTAAQRVSAVVQRKRSKDGWGKGNEGKKRIEVLFSGLGNTEQNILLVVWCPAGLLGLLLASPTAHGAAGEVVAGGTSLLPVRGCSSLQQQQ